MMRRLVNVSTPSHLCAGLFFSSPAAATIQSHHQFVPPAGVPLGGALCSRRWSSTKPTNEGGDNNDEVASDVINLLAKNPQLADAVVRQLNADGPTQEASAVALKQKLSVGLQGASPTSSSSVSSGDTSVAAVSHSLGDYTKLFVCVALPFFGFGVCDNIIMISVGDAIDDHFGVIMGFSTMIAAGLGQAVSDGSGITIQQTIERYEHKLGLPKHNFSDEELRASRMQWLLQFFRTIGIVCGCLFGLLPIILTDAGNKERLYDMLLTALPEDKRKAVASKATKVTFREGETLLKINEEADALYAITSGQVKIVGRAEDGTKIDICTQGTGSTVGHLELVFGHKCVADVIATTSVKALRISRADFLKIAGTDEVKQLVIDHIKEDPEFVPYRLRYGSSSKAETAEQLSK